MFACKIIGFIFLMSMLNSNNTAGPDGLEEINRQITSAISAGNTQELSKFFNSMVDCGILGVEDTFSKTQAARMIQDFFNKHTVKSVKINQREFMPDGSQYSIGDLNTGNNTYKIYYLLKKTSDSFLIQQIRIFEEH
jgi:hypothetical protein